ncbi:MAG: iron-containing alcohol dehydrogenase [Clostridiaceae bacterium]|nr:iron-containing alcohol dehydrogenase [Clostridiaceae bacterium]
MLDFNFYNPTRIIFGKDRLESMNDYIPADANVLIITYGVEALQPLIDKIKGVLGNRKVYEFVGIEPNPEYETCLKAGAMVREKNIDYLLAVGGGSVMDATKFIAVAAYYDGDPSEMLFLDRPAPVFIPEIAAKVRNVIPFGTVCTLPATGSEMNESGCITRNHVKCVMKDPSMFPKFSILDPTNTFSLPKNQITNGIVDTFVHATEQYLTYPVNARLQDRMAEGILQTLIEMGETTIAEPENYDERANLFWCATVAQNRSISPGVPQDWAAHAIGLELSVLFGLAHAEGVGVILPALLEERREQKREKLLQYAERVWHIDNGTDDEKIDLAIKNTREFFEKVGMKTHMSDYGIGADQIPAIIEKLKQSEKVALGERKDITLDISKKILERAL